MRTVIDLKVSPRVSIAVGRSHFLEYRRTGRRSSTRNGSICCRPNWWRSRVAV